MDNQENSTAEPEKQQQNNGKKLGGSTGKGFMPGKSGNPKGYPKGQTHIQTQLKRWGKLKTPQKILDALKEQYPEIKAKKLTLDEMQHINVNIAAAMGEAWAVHYKSDRLEGKAKEQVEVENNDRHFIVSFKDEKEAG